MFKIFKDKANSDVHNKIQKSGVRYWQVANALGLSDGHFSRKLRFELTTEEKVTVLEAIKCLSKKRD